MADQEIAAKTNEPKPFEVHEVLGFHPLTRGGEISVLLQSKRRDDGSLTRPFVTIKLQFPKRQPLWLRIEDLEDLASGLELMRQPAIDKIDELRKEAEERQAAWEAKQAAWANGGGGKPAARTGKTARVKAKDNYRSSTQRKADRAQNDRDERNKRKGRGGGK